jgi:hypothetical protein
VLDRGAQGGRAAEGVAHHVGLHQAEMPDEGGDVIGQGLVPQRPVHVRGVTMSLQVDRDNPALLGQQREDRSIHLAHAEAAVQQD